jgi:Icc-related predicted phosphoesterase
MRTITLQVPEEVSEEEIQAAVAALLEAKHKPKKEPLDLALFDNAPPSGRTVEEVEAALRADRASWGEREKRWRP